MTTQKSRQPNYSDVDFWNTRYGKGEPAHAQDGQGNFEWFPPQNAQDPVIKVLEDAGVRKGARILDIGCGNSRLSSQLLDAGYRRVVGIDFSPVVIRQMQQQCQGRVRAGEAEYEHVQQHFFVMDACKLSFSDGTFDAVVDKAFLICISTCSKGTFTLYFD